MPTVSVIIPAFNSGTFISQAVQSILDQTFKDFEIIIIDDGSTDQTKEILGRFISTNTIRYFYQENRGPSAARNEGIKQSRGKYIAFLDADDVWLPDKLNQQVAVLDNQIEIAVVYCGFRTMDETGLFITPVWEVPDSVGSLYEDLMYGNVIAGSGSSILVRKKCFKDVGLFDETLRGCEDQDMWRRLAEKYKFQFIDEPLVNLRVHPGSRQAKELGMALTQLRYLEKLRDDTPNHLRHHLPMVSHIIYWRVAYSHFANGNILKGFYYLVRISLLGPSHLIKLMSDVVKFILKRLGAKLVIVAK